VQKAQRKNFSHGLTLIDTDKKFKNSGIEGQESQIIFCGYNSGKSKDLTIFFTSLFGISLCLGIASI
jgi:hypothetical protein